MNIINRLFIAFFKQNAKRKIFSHRLSKIIPPNLYPDTNPGEVHFKHSGLLGDIIYSIPAMKVLAQGKKIFLHLNINVKSSYKKSMKHYNKGKLLTENSVYMLAPLLLSQPDFKACDIYSGQKIDYDLDEIRKYPFDYNSNYIPRFYFHIYGISADLGKPWLTGITPKREKSNILISRSFRYREPGINYEFLKAYPDLGFIGMDDEYEDIKKILPAIEHRKAHDFLELAQIIAGCKFFIGNQSFPFAIAEALKVKRVLEVHFSCPNIIPHGENAFDFCYQAQFEKIIKELYLEV